MGSFWQVKLGGGNDQTPQPGVNIFNENMMGEHGTKVRAIFWPNHKMGAIPPSKNLRGKIWARGSQAYSMRQLKKTSREQWFPNLQYRHKFCAPPRTALIVTKWCEQDQPRMAFHEWLVLRASHGATCCSVRRPKLLHSPCEPLSMASRTAAGPWTTVLDSLLETCGLQELLEAACFKSLIFFKMSKNTMSLTHTHHTTPHTPFCKINFRSVTKATCK